MLPIVCSPLPPTLSCAVWIVSLRCVFNWLPGEVETLQKMTRLTHHFLSLCILVFCFAGWGIYSIKTFFQVTLKTLRSFKVGMRLSFVLLNGQNHQFNKYKSAAQLYDSFHSSDSLLVKWYKTASTTNMKLFKEAVAEAFTFRKYIKQRCLCRCRWKGANSSSSLLNEADSCSQWDEPIEADKGAATNES